MPPEPGVQVPKPPGGWDPSDPDSEFSLEYDMPPDGSRPGLAWTYDAVANFIFGWTVRPEEHYPCAPPFPCSPVSGYAWEPGFVEPITLHPTRLIDRIRERSDAEANEEVCEYQIGGGCVLTPDGFVQPVFCNQPQRSPSGIGAIYHVFGYGIPAEADGSEVNGETPGLCESGMICGVAAYQTPPWMEVRFDAAPFTCGPPV